MKKNHKYIAGYIQVSGKMIKLLSEIEHELILKEAEEFRNKMISEGEREKEKFEQDLKKEKKVIKPKKEKKQLHGSPYK